jgi:hypothetical protein
MLQVQTAVTRQGTLKPHHVVAALLDLTDFETQLLAVTKIATTLDEPDDVPEAAASSSASIAL